MLTCRQRKRIGNKPCCGLLRQGVMVIALAVIILSFFSIANADDIHAEFAQRVYLVDKPLPKIREELVDFGMTESTIIQHLKTTLPQITREFAKTKFNIIWDDNFQQKNAPDVAVCYMGDGMGYGLFALENIRKGTIIAEYMGSQHIRDGGVLKPSNIAADLDLCSFNKSYAQNRGNAASFAQNLLTDHELSSYRYKDKRSGITLSHRVVAVANSRLLTLKKEGNERQFLVASENIMPFEQIGFFYGLSYGYFGSSCPAEPHLFNKSGDMISKNDYQVLDKGLMFVEPKFGTYELISPMMEDELKEIGDFFSPIPGYIVIPTGEQFFITDSKQWNEQIVRPQTRITILGYFVDSHKQDIERFVNELREADKNGYSRR